MTFLDTYESLTSIHWQILSVLYGGGIKIKSPILSKKVQNNQKCFKVIAYVS